MTSQPGKQTTAMHILPIISRSKGNQIKKSFTKCGGEAIPIPFSKKSKLSQKSKAFQSLNPKSKVLYSFMFLLHTKLRAIEIY